MDTILIEEALKRISRRHMEKWGLRLYTGVFASDQLGDIQPLSVNKNTAAIIVKTDPSNKPGTHWQAIWLRRRNNEFMPSSCYFFDSYGQKPTNDYILRFTENAADITVWQNQQLQDYESVCCGEYCLLFLYSMANGNSLKDFLKQYSKSDFNGNDEKAKRHFKKIFKIKPKKSRKCLQTCCTYLSYIPE